MNFLYIYLLFHSPLIFKLPTLQLIGQGNQRYYIIFGIFNSIKLARLVSQLVITFAIFFIGLSSNNRPLHH